MMYTCYLSHIEVLTHFKQPGVVLRDDLCVSTVFHVLIPIVCVICILFLHVFFAGPAKVSFMFSLPYNTETLIT